MPNQTACELVVVFPVCVRDAVLLQKSLEWQAELQTKWDTCVITHDNTLSPQWVERLSRLAARSYSAIVRHQYPSPKPGTWAPNQAFQQSALFMGRQNKPWLWMEADMIAMHRDWLADIQTEYKRCGMPFMGPMVYPLGHFNGTLVYPPNTPQLIPAAMRNAHVAWDVAMKTEMVDKAYDAGETIYHCWTMVNGRPHPIGGGSEPSFRDRESLRALPPTIATFHRCKDGSLIDRLRECRKDAR